MTGYFVTRNGMTSRLPLHDGSGFGLEQLLDEFWKPAVFAPTANQWAPACDFEEHEEHYLLSLEVPGVPKEQIKIELAGDQLAISGERVRESLTDSGTDASGGDGVESRYMERRYGKFSRTITLPSGINSEKLEADYQDGVLRIYLPKVESAKPRQIRIGGGSSGFFGKLLGRSAQPV